MTEATGPMVLQPIGDDAGNRILRWPVPQGFPAGPGLTIPPGLIAPSSPPQCWSPYGVTWLKPQPGGPIVYGPGGSYVSPAPQLPTASRGPAVQGAGVAMPGPGGAGRNGFVTNGANGGAGLTAELQAGTGGSGWLWLLAIAGVAWAMTRKGRA